MGKTQKKNPSPTPGRDGAPSRELCEPPVVGFVSLGCVKNLVDSEKMLGQIAEAGAIISGDESAADTIVVNTCGFLDAARNEVLEVLAELAERKRNGDLERIVVAGCLVQRDGKKLLEAVPEIDALVGVNNRDDIVPAVLGSRRSEGLDRSAKSRVTNPNRERERAAGTPRSRLGFGPTRRQITHGHLAPRVTPRGPRQQTTRAPQVDLYLGDYHPQPWSDQGRLRLTPRHYAYVRISEGCNQKCTFCTIPAIRGPLHCKTPDAIVAECRELITDGAHELILIGQDTTSYGDGLGYEPGLAGLLRKLDAECDGARWLRLMYAYPSLLTDATIDAIAECERIVKYIDIPLQHINDRVLRAMYRRVTRKQTEALLARIRQRIPGVTIRTTFMVGFPGETEAEFQELLDFVRDFGFDAVGTFKFSCEPDTPAGRMKDQLDESTKQERHDRLMCAQQEIAFSAARRRIGQTFEVVVDEVANAGSTIARHAGQAPEVDGVCLLRGKGFEPGRFLTGRCTGTDGYDLVVDAITRRR